MTFLPISLASMYLEVESRLSKPLLERAIKVHDENPTLKIFASRAGPNDVFSQKVEILPSCLVANKSLNIHFWSLLVGHVHSDLDPCYRSSLPGFSFAGGKCGGCEGCGRWEVCR